MSLIKSKREVTTDKTAGASREDERGFASKKVFEKVLKLPLSV